jgi:uncharacterized protein (DUF2336 family)
MPSAAAPSLIEELESAMASGSVERRTDMMRRVTDLFIYNSERLSEDQIRLFDDIITHLISHIERRAIAELSARLAPITRGPIDTIRQLARDDEIRISGPVLTQSELLTDADLVEIAGSKSDAHLVRIAQRTRLSEAVTDILVERGDMDVANEVAANQGAHFSKTGLSKLVLMSDGNDRLTETMGLRADIPPDLFRQLLAHATEAVRERLVARVEPETQEMIQKILADIGAQFGRRSTRQRDLAEAQRSILPLGQDTEVIRSRLRGFADGHRIPELIAALSTLTGVAIEIVDRLFHAPSVYATMVLCRAIGLDWPAAQAVIRGRPIVGHLRAADLEEAQTEYDKLSAFSAQRLLRFWQVRQKVA